MTVTARKFIREINIIATLLLITTGVLCIVYSNKRGKIQLSYTVNNTEVKTTPHEFSLGTIYGAMIGFTSLHHLFLAIWPSRTIRYLRQNIHADRWMAFAVVLPTTSAATVVGIAAVTDIFAVYSSISISVVLLFGLWMATKKEIWVLTKCFIVLFCVTLFLTFWLFVWAQTVRFTTPLLMYSTGTVIMLLITVGLWHSIKRTITREAILINVTVGLQLGCAGIWATLHDRMTASRAPLGVFFGVVSLFGMMCIYAVFRIKGTKFLDAVEDVGVEEDLGEELLPPTNNSDNRDTYADDDVFGPSKRVVQILSQSDSDEEIHASNQTTI